jgi:tight adherence protein C
MTVAAIAALALVVGVQWRWVVAAAGIATVAGGPLLGIGAVAAMVAVVAWRSARRRRAADAEVTEAELLAADAIAIGLKGGLAFDQAVLHAADSVEGAVGHGLRHALRRMSVPLPIESASASMERIFEAAASSRVSGGSIAAAVAAVAASAREEHDATARERLARVPVRMLFPLALFILPGFVLMTVGPAVVSGLSSLGL